MRYRLILALLVVVGVLFLKAPVALAHFPAYDKSMTVVLHIDPDDQPLAGQPARLNFFYEDSQHKFNPQKCNCQVTISEQGKRIFKAQVPLSSPSPTGFGLIPYTFKQPDVYKIGLSGSPTAGGDFAPFNVSWNFRVPTDLSGYSDSNKYYIVIFVALALAVVGTIGYFIYKDLKEA